MSFISPWFLLGLLGVGIPIYLHLYHKKIPIRKKFPSLRLIKDSVEHLAQRKKIRNLILMFLRLSLIILATMMMSRPFIGQSGSTLSNAQMPSAFIVLLDNSMSMGNLSKGISAFSSGKSRALEILNHMQNQDIATVGFINEPGGLELSQLTWDKETLKKIIIDAPLTIRGTNLSNAIFSSVKLLSPLKNHKKTLFVISDMTKSAWLPMINNKELAEIDKNIDLILIPVGGSETDNTAFIDIKIDSPIIMSNQKTTVKALIANYSSANKKIRATMTVNQERKDAKEVDINSDTEKEIEFEANFTKVGLNDLTISINGDSMPADNERHTAIKVYNPCKILIIKPQNLTPEKENKEDLFVKFALNPLNKSKDNYFITETRGSDELNNLNLSLYSAIILINQRHLEKQFVNSLSNYLFSGGNLITFLGDRCEPDWYNENLYNNLGGKYILPCKIYKRVGNATSKNIYYQLTELDTGHPAFKLFAKDENGDPSYARIYEFFQVNPNEQALVLSRMSHGFPAIIEENRGSGKSMLITFPADTKWSNWPLRATWLPFLHQSLISMITAQDIAINNIKPAMPVSIALNQDANNIFLTNPMGEKTNLEIQKGTNNSSHIIIRDTENAGYYSVQNNKAEVLTGFAVNPPPEESKLSRINLREIPRFVPLKQDSQKESIKDSVAVIKDGYELSQFLLILLILLALIENVIANKLVRTRVD